MKVRNILEEKYEFTAEMNIMSGELHGIPQAVLFLILLAVLRIDFGMLWLNAVLSLLFGASLLFMLFLKGTVTADGEGVTVRAKLFFIPVMFKSYYYADVKKVECGVRHHHARFSNYHSMDFNISIFNKSSYHLQRKLKVSHGHCIVAGCEDMLELAAYVEQRVHEGYLKKGEDDE